MARVNTRTGYREGKYLFSGYQNVTCFSNIKARCPPQQRAGVGLGPARRVFTRALLGLVRTLPFAGGGGA